MVIALLVFLCHKPQTPTTQNTSKIPGSRILPRTHWVRLINEAIRSNLESDEPLTTGAIGTGTRRKRIRVAF